MKQIQLKTNAQVAGVLRSPGQGPIKVAALDADRLIEDGYAVEVTDNDKPASKGKSGH